MADPFKTNMTPKSMWTWPPGAYYDDERNYYAERPERRRPGVDMSGLPDQAPATSTPPDNYQKLLAQIALQDALQYHKLMTRFDEEYAKDDKDYADELAREAHRRQLGRGTNRNNNNNAQRGNGSPAPSPTSYTGNNGIPQLPSTSSLASQQSVDSQPDDPPKFFFKEKYATLILKGNFMTLAAQPKNVDLGEWLAHQIVEQHRLLGELLQLISEVDQNTGLPLCNPKTCPTMYCGRHVYSWLSSDRKPVPVAASVYIGLVQKWIFGKIQDSNIFPTDPPLATLSASNTTNYASGSLVNTPGAQTPPAIPAGPTNLTASLSTLSSPQGPDWVGKSSGFPEHFYQDCKNMMRQMFRCYAHLYHGHWLDPFYHVNKYPELNSCFVHFVTVAKLFGLLSDKDMEPMRPLIEIFQNMKAIPSGDVPMGGQSSGSQTLQSPISA